MKNKFKDFNFSLNTIDAIRVVKKTFVKPIVVACDREINPSAL